MEDKIELNVFLNKLVSAIVKKFESIENDMKNLRMEVDRLKQTNDKSALKDLEDKMRTLEYSINSLKNKNQIDKSILNLIEKEEDDRKGVEHGRRV